MWLELQDVARRFGARSAVSGLTFRLPKGSIGCLLGPSGCGKTTALRCIAGFEPVDAGSIRAHGRVLSTPELHRAAGDVARSAWCFRTTRCFRT